MYSRILVPLDGSELAEQVLPYVRLLAKAFRAPVDLFRTYSPSGSDLADPVHVPYLEEVMASFRSHAQGYLDTVKTSLHGLDAPVSTVVREGDAATQIVGEAERDPSCLVAISTHGRSGISRWVLGSVTDKVLHATTNPLLIVRSQDHERAQQGVNLESVIVPLDGSPAAEQILPHVVALAGALGLKVVLVRVVPSGQVFHEYGEYVTFRYEDISKYLDDEATSYLEQMIQMLKEKGVSPVEASLMHGYPAASIVDRAVEVPNSLVAMTTHGRSGIGRWVLGSVTDRVVRHSGSPVLVIRAVQ